MATETVQRLLVSLQILGLVTGPNGASQAPNLTVSKTFSDGNGTLQVSNWYYQTDRVLATGNEDLNLSTLTDFQGDALGSKTAKVIFLRLKTCDSGGTLTAKQAASNGLVGPFDAAGHGAKTLDAGGIIFLMTETGWTVTASTGDLINVAVSSNSTYDIFVGVGT